MLEAAVMERDAFLSSEALTADVRRRVRDAWGIEPVSGYAATEGRRSLSAVRNTLSWRSPKTSW